MGWELESLAQLSLRFASSTPVSFTLYIVMSGKLFPLNDIPVKAFEKPIFRF